MCCVSSGECREKQRVGERERERKKSALGEVGPQRHIYSGQTLLVCTSALARERAREEEKGGEREGVGGGTRRRRTEVGKSG